MIAEIKKFPKELSLLVANLTVKQLTTPYKNGEWTIAQNVHHIADVHINKYALVKQILSENSPILREHAEKSWAEMQDSKSPQIQTSLFVVKGLHKKLVILLESLKKADWQRRGRHPVFGEITLEDLVESFSTHGQRHIAQIKKVKAELQSN